MLLMKHVFLSDSDMSGTASLLLNNFDNNTMKPEFTENFDIAFTLL